MTHICVRKLTITGQDNSLSPGRRQAIIWTNAGMLLIGPLGTNFNEIFIEIYTFSLKKMHLQLSSGEWRSFFLGLNVLNVSHFVQDSILTHMCIIPLCQLTADFSSYFASWFSTRSIHLHILPPDVLWSRSRASSAHLLHQTSVSSSGCNRIKRHEWLLAHMITAVILKLLRPVSDIY